MDNWFTPSILVSLGSFLAACAGSFAVVRYQVGEVKQAVVDLRRDVVSKAEYETQIQALNAQITMLVNGVNRLTDRVDRVLDAQR